MDVYVYRYVYTEIFEYLFIREIKNQWATKFRRTKKKNFQYLKTFINKITVKFDGRNI